MPRLLNVEDDGGGKVRRKVKGRGGSAEIESAVLDRPLPLLFGPGGGFRRVRTRLIYIYKRMTIRTSRWRVWRRRHPRHAPCGRACGAARVLVV